MQIYAAYKFPDRDFAFGGQDAPQPLPVTSMSAGGFEHHVHTTFDSEEGGVQSEMIILHDAPLTAGVVPVIGSALRIAVQQELFRLFRLVSLLAQDAVDPELHIGMQEDVHAVGALTQDVVGTTADDHARLLFREVADQVVLNHIQPVRNRQGTAAGARRQRPVEEEGVGGFGILAVLFDELFGQTAFSGDLRDEFLVVAGDAEPFRDFPADGASTAAEFPADGDNANRIHDSCPFIRKTVRAQYKTHQTELQPYFFQFFSGKGLTGAAPDDYFTVSEIQEIRR